MRELAVPCSTRTRILASTYVRSVPVTTAAAQLHHTQVEPRKARRKNRTPLKRTHRPTQRGTSSLGGLLRLPSAEKRPWGGFWGLNKTPKRGKLSARTIIQVHEVAPRSRCCFRLKTTPKRLRSSPPDQKEK
jgi:hypothetical protein